MANVSEQSDVTARDGRPFVFTRTRGSGAAEEFFPGAGARLRFANCDTDTLTLPALPIGLLIRGDAVSVAYNGTTVFRGTVATRTERQGRGTDRVEDVVCEGPWGLMARLVFRQSWQVAGPGGQIATFSSNLVLNQSADGVPQDMSAQVLEIAGYAAGPCGFACAEEDIDAGTQQLPPDEARDITCAAAIVRTLRFFPQTVCRFDYSRPTPAFHVSMPPPRPTSAAYLASIPMTQRSYARTAHPVVGVDITTEGYDVVTGDDEIDATLRKLTHQEAGVTDSIDTLHVFLPLEKGSSSTSWESLDVKMLDPDHSIFHSLNFWIANHPALAGYTVLPPGQSYDGSGNRVAFNGNITPATSDLSDTPNMTDTTVGDLERFGLRAQVVRLTCPVKVYTPDKVEEQVLTLDYVFTNATERTYTRQTGSSSTAGETLPEGLAAAILAQRGGEVMGEEVTIRLGGAFPTLGDADVVGTDVLYLQSFDVDCYDLTARLHFGRPPYLSPEDMRDLLLGFRQRGFASNTPNRNEPDADDNMEDVGGVQPITSSSAVVKSVKKTTIGAAATGGTVSPNSIIADASKTTGPTFGLSGPPSSGHQVFLSTDGAGAVAKVQDSYNKVISLNAGALPANKTMGVHTLTYTDGSGNQQSVQVLATDDAAIPAGGGGGGGEEEDPDMPDFADGLSGTKLVCVGMRYDENTHKFQALYATVTYTSGIVTEWTVPDPNQTASWTDVFTAEEHSPGENAV